MTLAALPADYAMKPCAHCQSKRMRLHSWDSHGRHHRVICLNANCNAQGPRAYDEQVAMDLWNARTATEFAEVSA